MIARLLTTAAALSVATAAAAEPLRFHNGRLFILARVNNVATEALLDSGAEATLLDPAFAAKAKLPEGAPQVMKGSGGTAQARIVEGVKVEALGLDLQPEVVVVTDLTDLSNRLLKRPTQVIVGRELFDAARVLIDLSRGDIAVASKHSEPRGRKLPLTAHAGIEAIPVLANGTRAQAEFDLGNGSDVMVSRALAGKLKLKIIGKKAGGGIGGEIMRDVVTLKTLEIGGARFRDVVATIDDQPGANDMNVGTSILKHFLITTDFKHRLVWLEPVGKIN
jgi:predicted aspartyl protease